jgi:lipid-A-disaccharide synthase
MPTSRLMLDFLAAAARAASCADPRMHGDAPRLAMVAGEASGDLLAALLLGGCGSAGRDLQLRHRRPAMAEQGFEAWWPQRQAGVRGYVDVLRHYPELSASAGPGRALLPSGPRPSSASTRPTSTSAWKQRLAPAGIKTIHFVCPSIWAWRGGRVKKHRAQRGPCAVPVPVRARAAAAPTAWRHLRRPSAGRRDPAAGAARAGAATLGLAEHDTVVAVLPGSRRARSEYIAPAFLQACALMQRQRPGLRFVLPVAPGLRERCCSRCSRSMRRTCRWRCSTAVARRAGRLRRDADRQRHRHARGGAVQAADGHRLPHARLQLAC